MSADWDFYCCRVDDKPASTYLDLAAIAHAPQAHRPFMARAGHGVCDEWASVEVNT